MSKPSLLFITDESPELIGGGALVYVNSILDSLCREFAVSVLVCDPDYHRKHSILRQDKAYEKYQPGYLRAGHLSISPSALFNQFKKRIGLHPYHHGNNDIERSKRDLITIARRQRTWSCVIVNYYRLCHLLDLFPNSYTAVITHDVWHQHIYFTSGESGALTVEDEAEQLAKADLVVAISENDQAAFKQMLPKQLVCVARPTIKLVNKLPAEVSKPYSIVYVASNYAANIEGLEWLSKEVCPLLPDDDPMLNIHVTGTICSAVADRPLHPRIKLEGGFYSTSTVYEHSNIVIAPILRGTGVKIKVVEALAYGRPLVVTPKAIEGIEYLQDYGVFCETQPEAFAHCLVKLANDAALRQKCAEANLQAARKYHSPVDAHTDFLQKLLKGVSANLK